MRITEKQLEKRLSDCGIDLGIYNRAMAFFLERQFRLGYNPEKGMFFVSAIISIKGKVSRQERFVADITDITDKPSYWIQELQKAALQATIR